MAALKANEKSEETGKYVQVERDNVNKEIATLTMVKNPRNSMSIEFMREMKTAFDKLENDDTCRGVILTSAVPSFFSSGLDAHDMYQKPLEYIGAYWKVLQDLWMSLYGSRLAVVAAINGHCAAGGLMMALCSDYRVMSEGNFLIGFYNTVNLGIPFPFWFQELLVKTCGERQTEMLLQLATMFPSDQALKIGMVDKLAPLKDVINEAREELVKWLNVTNEARVAAKREVRRSLLEKVRAQQEEQIVRYGEIINDDTVQKTIGDFLATFKLK